MNYKPLLYVLLIFSLVSTVSAFEVKYVDRFVTACNGINVSLTTPANTVPNIACADPTGGRLRNDDGLQEIFNSAKGFLGSSAGGVQATALNTSIDDCATITKVQVCVDRDGVNTVDDSCVSHVDLNGDGVFTTFDGVCNDGYWNNTFNCYDVTTAESGYSCDNLFSGSTGFRAKSFSYKGGANGFGTVTHDQLWFNVTYQTPNEISATSEIVVNLMLAVYILMVGIVAYGMITSGVMTISSFALITFMLAIIPLLADLIRGLL